MNTNHAQLSGSSFHSRIQQTLADVDAEFNRLQTSLTFFIFEVIFAGYVLLNLALIAEHFLMPSLLNIARRYRLSRDVTGIVVAIGNSVPELTTTMLSFMKHGVKMTEFGIASNIGCAVLTITVVPSVAILATLGKITLPSKLEAVQQSKKKLALEAEIKQRIMMITIYRDMGFFILALIVYDVILMKGIIYFYEACLIFGMLALYTLSIAGVNRYSKVIEKKMMRRPKFMQESERNNQEGEMEVIMVQRREIELSTYENPQEEHLDEIMQQKHLHQDECDSLLTDEQQPRDSKSDSHGGEQAPEGKVLHYLEIACSPTLTVLRHVLPLEKLPEVAFLVIVCIFFIATDFILTVVSVFSVYTRLSHVLIALIVIAWGSSPIELINLVIAAKRNELQLGLTSVLSGVVLAFYLLIPMAMLFKMAHRGTHEIQILQPIHSSHMLIYPALLVAFLSLAIYAKTGMKLGRGSAGGLLALYGGYMAWMAYALRNDPL
ncbi:hypothetical protein FGO68_gene5201 [Halteria grandinella]|uniref:Sodium/calcium exchanger membrane region domain-containing protein n=1 Tax=Halteria grandinella TaxID=5974 RepID=A0A8J8T2A7_HALGN|nr:hypothetical protein FGO68_gene5201 [Halteria grandinella]